MKKLRLPLFLAVILLSVGLVACTNGSKKENQSTPEPDIEYSGSEIVEEDKGEEDTETGEEGSIPEEVTTEGSDTEGNDTEDPVGGDTQIKQYAYTVMAGDYFSFGGDSITIEDITNHAGIDRTYLYKLFVAYEHCSPIQYLTKYRLEIATQFLDNHNYSITDAALAVGYFDHSHFSRHFKKSFGVSPGEYRQKRNNTAE